VPRERYNTRDLQSHVHMCAYILLSMCNKTHSGSATDVTIFKIVSPKDLAKKCLPRKAAFWVKLVNYSFAKTVLQILTLAPWISAIFFLCTYVCTHAFCTRWIETDNWTIGIKKIRSTNHLEPMLWNSFGRKLRTNRCFKKGVFEIDISRGRFFVHWKVSSTSFYVLVYLAF
jgi:hypothetical protein